MKKRYRILYAPSGGAGEYSDHGYAANLFRGCLHGCEYCYAPGVLRQDKYTFHDCMIVSTHALMRLEKDLREVGILPEPIFLCFTCDPFPPDESLCLSTMDAIHMIKKSGNNVNILTKGGIRAVPSFKYLTQNDKIGATLTFIHPGDSIKWEPLAALPSMRMEMLKIAHSAGIQTWASMEPVLDPQQTLELIRETHTYVDMFKIGKWNHDARAKKIDWPRFREDAIMLCNHLGVKFMIKRDLAEAK